MQKFKQTGDTKYIYKNESDKACFQHDNAYGDYKDLAKRAASDKAIENMVDIKEVLLLWFINL